ncbi:MULTISPECIES: carboxymuconolactone decarboxylase family protein [Hyphomonas]|uniref:Alkylhydroperoxidase n=2 Tax=Hyphomonas adhaerens TaxID=81029 RepID=A0A069E8L8_9PROT|nr:MULTISPECIES: carboxymuconolactone decarboxylase family protein [Hyphomonas]KCZ84356.1 alkylhydroperoxidase [Hyphomonas adhaerens MHS-3]|tara:strand:+ start:693 stop:1046 length:354 start_codon:yes stop_codon:yes gene_type:complete
MSMGTKDFAAITGSISQGIGGLRSAGAAETVNQFNAMSKAALEDGALDKKTKELIALSIGVAKQCDGCIGFHTKALKRLGATDGEVAEALGMTVYMGGGPALMYAGDAWNAWQALKD